MTEVFTPEWTLRLAETLNSDAGFRSAAADWNGVLGLAMVAGGVRRISILELTGGRCTSRATDPDVLAPDYVIEASEANWKSVFDGRLDPMWGLMSGKLRLARGRLTELAERGGAALRIVACARTIPSSFPSDRSARS